MVPVMTFDEQARATLDTMNVKELCELCDDIGIFDEAFTTMKLLSIFCKVNIDDALYEQEDEENTCSELVPDRASNAGSADLLRTSLDPACAAVRLILRVAHGRRSLTSLRRCSRASSTQPSSSRC